MRQPGQLAVERSHQCVAPRLIHLAAAADVALEPARAHERGERVLLKAGYGGRIQRKPLMITRHQRVRQHQIPDAQAGRQALCKGVDIDHPPHAVQLAQRGDGARGIAELAVVIVLDDIPVWCCGRPAQNLQPAGGGHDRAQRKVVRRGQVDRGCVTRGKHIRTQAALIQRKRTHRRPVCFKDLI